MKILGIETSCDETAAAVLEGKGEKIEILSNVISSQIAIHQKYGGIVPEVAAREHVGNIIPVINDALENAGIEPAKAKDKIDALAVTVGPGLITSLTIGVEATKALSYAWNLPVVAVNHIEGHIYANLIDNRDIVFPALVLTVSGGHTLLVLMREHGFYETLGETRDDAAGEAFDKAAQLLGLGFPGGPAISNEAKKHILDKNAFSIKLPRPMINSTDFDFSFSGLKTALLYELKKDKLWKERIGAYAYEFEQSVSDVLVSKTIKAATKYQIKTIMLSGGVSANSILREKLREKVYTDLSGTRTIIPELKYTTDNAAMIATAGYYHALKKDYCPWQKLQANCNLSL